MSILKFPPVESADESGLLAIGGDLEIDSLLLAYENGIFPWPISDEYPLAWFSPNPRGVLKFSDFHCSKSFKKFIKNTSYWVEYNQNFSQVIQNCATAKRKDQDDTWITDEIIQSYIDFNSCGLAYSVETYDMIDNQKTLVGGLYGVCIGNFFSGESMFYTQDNASKFALYSLMNKLHENGIEWLDTQMVTPIIKDLGGSEVRRSDFLKMIKQADIHSRRPSQIFNT